MKLTRYKNNPVISPTTNWWEVQATFNPGAIIFNKKILLLYRAIGGDNLSRFGLAESQDGFNFKRLSEPVLEGDTNNPYERLGIEDPRITKIDGIYYIVYTAPSVYEAAFYKQKKFAPSLSHPAPWRVRPSLITTSDFKAFDKRGVLLELDTKDATLFPEKINGFYVLLHRIYPHVYLSFSADLVNWQEKIVLLGPRPGFWDCERVGAGSVPIKTDKGWLLFYHGTDEDHVYRLGVLFLDLADPTKILYRSEEPILEPQEGYEKIGLTPNVVFTCGVIEKDADLLIYYGAADKVIAVATITTEKLLNSF